MPPKQFKHCQFCRKAFATQRAVNQHISASITCLKEWHKNIIRINDNPSPKRRRINSPEPVLLDDLPNADNILIEANNRANVEDNKDQLGDVDKLATPKRYIKPFPGPAGVALRQEKTCFESLREIQQLEGKDPWKPFASRTEWGLVEWLIKNVGQKSTDKFLQLPIVS
jgi:hypothetical protein